MQGANIAKPVYALGPQLREWEVKKGNKCLKLWELFLKMKRGWTFHHCITVFYGSFIKEALKAALFLSPS